MSKQPSQKQRGRQKEGKEMQARSRLACHTLCRNGDVSLLTQALTLIRNRILSILGYRRRRFTKSLVSFCPLPPSTRELLSPLPSHKHRTCFKYLLSGWKRKLCSHTARSVEEHVSPTNCQGSSPSQQAFTKPVAVSQYTCRISL